MPVQAPSLTDHLEAAMPAAPGLYVEPGIGGVIIASVYDATGKLIREDHIAQEHFDAPTLKALTEWSNRHQHAPPLLKLG